jgi:hypothetical protein
LIGVTVRAVLEVVWTVTLPALIIRRLAPNR